MPHAMREPADQPPRQRGETSEKSGSEHALKLAGASETAPPNVPSSAASAHARKVKIIVTSGGRSPLQRRVGQPTLTKST
jgi:hypothetical protein